MGNISYYGFLPNIFWLKGSWNPRKNGVKFTKNVQKPSFYFVFASPENLLFKFFIWSSRCQFLNHRKNKDFRFWIFFTDNLENCVLKLGIFPKIPVFLEANNVFICTKKLRQNLKVTALYVVFYSFCEFENTHCYYSRSKIRYRYFQIS